MNDITSNNAPRQLSLIESQFASIRRIEHDYREYFSLVDIMAVFSDLESRPSVLWKRTKERLKKDGFQLDQKVIQLKMASPKDGKMYATDCTDGDTAFRIVQSIPSPVAEDLRQWLAELGYRAYEEARNPTLAVIRREQELARLNAAGYGDHPAVKLFRKRHQNIDTFKSLMATVGRVCEKPQYGQFVNSEYLAMFGEIASDLKIILGSESIRDTLPYVQLSTLEAAEARLQFVLDNQDRMSMESLLEVIDIYVKPMGDDLRAFCDAMGVHHITGQKLIAD